MSEELLPCPFCGAQAEHIHVYAGEEVVKCMESCAVFNAETFEEAAAQWNRRAPAADGNVALHVGGELFVYGSPEATALVQAALYKADEAATNVLHGYANADEVIAALRAAKPVHPTPEAKEAWRQGCAYGLSIGRKDPAIQEAAYMRGYKGAQAISQMLLEACRDALEMSAQQFAEEMTDWRLKRVQKALREVKAAMANGIGADVTQVYAAGWRKCAKWADRADLVADIGSPAYERDRVAAMVKLGGES